MLPYENKKENLVYQDEYLIPATINRANLRLYSRDNYILNKILSGSNIEVTGNLSDLSDTNPDGNINDLIVSTPDNMWENIKSQTHIEDLYDVDINNLENGDVLYYVSGDNNWQNNNVIGDIRLAIIPGVVNTLINEINTTYILPEISNIQNNYIRIITKGKDIETVLSANSNDDIMGYKAIKKDTTSLNYSKYNLITLKGYKSGTYSSWVITESIGIWKRSNTHSKKGITRIITNSETELNMIIDEDLIDLLYLPTETNINYFYGSTNAEAGYISANSDNIYSSNSSFDTIEEHLDALSSSIPDNITLTGSDTDTVFGRDKFVVSTSGDYDSDIINYGKVADNLFTKIAISPYEDIYTEGAFSLGLSSNGDVLSWGENKYGQLGNGEFNNFYTYPVNISGDYSFVDIKCGVEHALALSANGDVYAWGYNYYGQLGTGDTSNYSIPTSVSGGLSFIEIQTGDQHSLALSSNGDVYAWGYNKYGQLGNGTITNKSMPIKVSEINNFTTIYAGSYHSLGLSANGDAYAWGNNWYGQLGICGTTHTSYPYSVWGGKYFTDIKASGTYSLGLSANGDVYAWGNNRYGQLGNGEDFTNSYSTPISVIGGHKFKNIYAGASFILALSSNNDIWAWGTNYWGQFGDSNPDNSYSSPILAISGYNFSDIKAGAHFTLGLNSDGTVYGWGYNKKGQIGNGTTTNYSSPTSAALTNYTTSKKLNLINSDFNSNSGILNAINIKYDNIQSYQENIRNANGYMINPYELSGELSGIYINGNLGYKINSNSENIFTIDNNNVNIYDNDINFIETISNSNFVPECYDEYEYEYKLNNINSNNNNLFIQNYTSGIIYNDSKFEKIQKGYLHSLALSANGDIYSWGNNTAGQLGTGDETFYSIPTIVSGDFSFTDIQAGYVHSLALSANGDVYAWGYNYYGELGTGNKTSYLMPTIISGDFSFTDIQAGHYYSLALSANGNVYGWGYNYNGQLGTGDRSMYSMPTIVSGDFSFTDIQADDSHSLALSANGDAYAWGYNNKGQLGTGNQTSYSMPTIISGDFSFTDIQAGYEASLALSSNGNVYGWGDNNNGLLGTGNKYSHLIPVILHKLYKNSNIDIYNKVLNSYDNYVETLTSNSLYFGDSLAVSGDFLMVGEPNISTSGKIKVYNYNGSTTWNDLHETITGDVSGFGNQLEFSDNELYTSAPSANKVYRYEFNSGSWDNLQYTYNTLTGNFGSSIKHIIDNYIVIGAPLSSKVYITKNNQTISGTTNGFGNNIEYYNNCLYISDLTGNIFTYKYYNNQFNLLTGDTITGNINDDFAENIHINSNNNLLISAKKEDVNGNSEAGKIHIYEQSEQSKTKL